MRAVWFAFALLAVVVATGACAKRPASENQACADADAGTPVDPALLAFLSSARSAHHSADLREQQGDLPAAGAVLEGFIKGPRPLGAERPEVSEVLADSQARLADLYSRQGQTERAFAAVEAGLQLAREPNYFRGHLFEVQGVVEQRRAEALAKSGDEAGAGAARDRALKALEEAMRIQSEVIQKAAPEAVPPR